MTTHEEYIARIETLSGMPMKELKSLKPRELWRRLHGDIPIKVRSFFPAIGSGGSVQWARKETRVRKAKTDIKNLLIGFIAGILSGVCVMRVAL